MLPVHFLSLLKCLLVWLCEGSDHKSSPQITCDSIEQRQSWLVTHFWYYFFFYLCLMIQRWYAALSLCFSGELVGHKDLVSGFSFCQHAGQSHICVSSSNDGSVRFWDSDNKVLIREHAAHQVSVYFPVLVCHCNRNCFCFCYVMLMPPAGCSQLCTSSREN